MFRTKLIVLITCLGGFAYGQNENDALRYSRVTGGGTARFISMGGAFGAVGADLTSAAYNPAGLGVFRKGEMSFGAGFRSTNNSGELYNKSVNVFDVNLIYNNFGIAGAWKNKIDPDSRHVLAFTSTQLQNFSNSTRMSGYTNSSSLGKDMLNLASYYNGSANMTGNLNSMYEGLGYQAYLLDTINGAFYSYEDPKRTVKQTRDLVTSGKVNDLNFSYAYSYKDKFYLGGSIGVPQVRYESTLTHTEFDDRDSMRIILTSSSTFSDTYVDPIPYLNNDYVNRLGFKSLEYTEYFKTTGTGVNLKLGGIVRANDMVRLGFYYHTPTVYNLQDSYYNSLAVTFDRSGSTPDFAQDPPDGGIYKYKIITPGKVSLSAAFVLEKKAVIGIDYEMVDYRKARLGGGAGSNFDDVNSYIKDHYQPGHNLRIGGEMNLNPLMLRVGYMMQGSPMGHVFVGPDVRNTLSAGFGFRTKSNFFFDFVVYKALSYQNYYMFSTMNTQARLKYNSTSLSATIGLKF